MSIVNAGKNRVFCAPVQETGCFSASGAFLRRRQALFGRVFAFSCRRRASISSPTADVAGWQALADAVIVTFQTARIPTPIADRTSPMPDPSGASATTISVAELESLIQSVDPSVLFLSPRILRRAIKRIGRVPGLGLQVPHRKSLVCSRAALVQAVDAKDLAGARSGSLPEVVILLPRPRPERLARRSRPEVLLQYWRLLFHAQVHRALDQKAAAGKLTETVVRERIDEIGLTSFEEIRQVLEQEKYLAPNAGAGDVYREFAAVYLELFLLAPALLPWYFPSLGLHESIRGVLARDVDAESILARTRPPGAPEPATLQPETDAGVLAVSAKPQAALGEMSHACGFAAADLVQRLRAALHLGDTEAEAWTQALGRLAGPEASSAWTQERRLLYDLQNVCIDSEREVYALDLIEWAASLGRRPIRRLLPGQGLILSVKHLRRALARVPALTLPAAERFALAALLEAALHGAEHRLRERLRPLIEDTLDQVGLCPRDFPERVARQKLTEELLDRVTERGFLNLGDLRDALSRNQLKLPDLASAGEWLGGDPLIEADRRFAEALDGIYRRGEIYMRGLQRLSSAAFATAPGRLFTLFVALPFGGAFFILEGLQHLVNPVAKLLAPPLEAPPEEHLHLLNSYSFVALGVFLLSLLHWPAFRAAVLAALSASARALIWLWLEVPRAIMQQPLVKSMLASRPFLWVKQFLLKPLLWTIPVGVLLAVLPLSRTTGAATSLAWFLGTALLLNSRLGRDLEETASDWLARTWKQIHSDFLPGIFWWIMGLFKGFLETSERLLYAVDEWLRFRAGDGRWAMLVKPVLGAVWFFVTYVIRIFLNLFVEPTVNPIKHFPVVTVAAKLILPIIPGLTHQFETVIGPGAAGVLAGFVIVFVPGLAGFLVWEFKENWKLYRANRAPSLRPVVIGHHGETMMRLLRPGVHSGTIPKQFAKLRKASRRTQRLGGLRAYRRQRRQLLGIEQAVRHFIEREFIFLVNTSKSWTAPHVSLGAIDLATSQIDVELACPSLKSEPARIVFTLKAGVLHASVADAGWLPLLTVEQQRLVHVALAGVCKLGGVDEIDNQVPPAPRFGEIEIPWSLWVETWEREEAGKGLPATFPDGQAFPTGTATGASV